MRFRTLGVFVFVVLAARSSSADTFTLIGSGQWGNTAIWNQNGVPATRFPGQQAGTIDTVSTPLAFYSVVVDVGLTEAVVLTTSCPSNTSTCVVDVTTGVLRTTGSSTIGTDARLKISGGGSIVNTGTLTLASASNLDWTNGTLRGSGNTNAASGSIVNAAGPSSMILDDLQILNLSGTFNYSGGQFVQNGGADVIVKSGGVFDIQTLNGITTDNAATATVTVESGGTFLKSNANFGTNINPTFNNDGTVQVNIGSLTFARGTHTGAFVMSGGGITFAFGGTHTFNGTTGSISGTGLALFGGPVALGTGADLDISNFQSDGFSSISGFGTINVSGTWTWIGGTVSNGTVNMLAASVLNQPGTENVSLTAAAHLNNQGTITFNPGAGALSITGDAHITNNGTINIAGDLTINSDGAPLSRIDNLATRSINKTAGAGSAIISVPLNNAGSVSALSGVLKLQQGGTHSGSWGVGTGAGIAFDGGTHQITGGGTFSGSTGTVALTNGILDVDVPVTISLLTFQQTGGTLTGSGNFTVTGTFIWSGGRMDNSSGTGQTVISSGNAQIAGTTSTLVLSGRTLSTSNLFIYNPTVGIELSIDDGATLLNTGTFNLVGDAEIDSNFNATPKFTNGVGGVINKSTGTGSAGIYAYFSNNNTLNLTSGSITLFGGGQNLGTVNFGGVTNKIIIDVSTFSLTTQPTLNGGGVIAVQGGQLGLTGAITIPNLEITGGTVAGGTLNVSTSLLWQAGTMLGGVTTIPISATVTATSLTGPITLDTHSLTNSGTFTWDGSNTLQLINGSSLINNGTFTATGNGIIDGVAPANAITNNGTFEKTGGTSGTRINPSFGNSGQLSSEVAGQSLIIAGGGSQTGGGSLVTFAGALIDFFAGTYTVPSGTSPFMGSGIFRVNGGTLSITGSMIIPSPASLTVQSGTLTVAVSTTFQMPGGLTWTGGTIGGNGTTRPTGGSISGLTTLNNNHTLSVAGSTLSYSGTQLTIGGTAALNVESGATLAMAAGSAISGTSTDGVTLNGGTLDVTAGSSTLGHGSMTSGAIATGASGTLNLLNGTFTITGGSVTGTGTISTGGSQTLTVNTAFIFPNLAITNGTLTGTGNVTVNGGSWTGGTMSGTGTTTINGPFTISGTTPLTLARNLTNLGTVNAGPTNTLNFTGAAVLTNSGTWNDSNRQLACVGCTGRFHNATGGIYNKTGGAGTLQQQVKFDNDGTVTVVAPTGVAFNGGGAHTGDFTTGGDIWFAGTHTFASTSDTTGTGSLVFNGTATHLGTINLSGAASTITIQSTANVAFNTPSPVTSPKFAIAGNISGTGGLSLTSLGSTWTGGTISGTGAFSVGSGADLSISNSTGTPTLDGRTLTNNGTLAVTGNLAAGLGGGSIVNLSGFRSQPTGSITIAPAFTNQSLAQFLGGTTTFNGGYTQTAGSTQLAGGNFGSPLTINIDAGTVSGNGTITGNVINDGTFSPGASAGTITIAGNFTQSGTGIINSEIGGTAPGTGYDQLVVTGAAALDGTMNVTLINAFSPADANVFDLLTWASHTGAFAAVNLPPFPAGSLNVTYEPNAFRITADAIGDLGVTKTGPASAGVGQSITYTIVVNNGGPSPTDNVVVTDPTPANLTFVSNSGACTTAFPCSLGTIAAGATMTITATYTVNGGAGSNVTNTASVTTTSTDNVSANNTSSVVTFIDLADVSVSKSGPATTAAGQNVSFTITVNNAGPSAAAGVVVNDPTPANMTFVSNSGNCTTAFPCSLGSIGAGVSKTIVATYAVTGGAGGNITNTATVSTTTTESTTANNSSSATVFVDLSDVAISKTGPATAQAGDDISFTITVVNGGLSTADNVVVDDPPPGGLTFRFNSGDCTTAFPCSLGSMPSGATKTIVATYTVAAVATGTTVTNTATVTTTTADGPANNSATATVDIGCVNSAPTALAPTGNAAGSGTLSWNGNGDSYVVYLGPAGSGCTTQFATTEGKSVPYANLAPGTYEWRVKSFAQNCDPVMSACATFTVSSICTVPEAPIVSVVGQTTSAKTYDVQWPAVAGAVRYEIEESTNAEFVGATRQTITGTSQAFKHEVGELATAFYYRVRAFAECTTAPGPFSTTVRVVIIPLPPKEQANPQVNVPAGSEEVVVQTVFIPGQPGQNLFFTATTDRPWLTVRPPTGALTPNGVNLEVIADPKTLPNGTFTASIIVTITDGSSGGIGTNGTSIVTTPFSINLVTPVTPIAAKPATSQYSLVIPTAGHLDGLNSHWQSDIRVTNAGFKSARYQLTFTPSGGTAQGVKQTTINVDAGATTALDDIVRNWFGLGTLNDGANGMLEILPLDDPATTSLTTVASSRTYNVKGNGTLGQYIPAVPFPSFIGKALPGALPQVLSLQQIAQSSAYRTNIGLAEAGGGAVNAVLTVFNANGSKLTDIPVELAAGQQLQMNQVLKTHGIELTDGRVEVKVNGGDGKITAYASVVDNATQDPLLVSGTSLSSAGASKFVLPGVANLDNSLAHWRTDMRVFNYGTSSQPATLTFFPFNNGQPKTANVLLGAGQVMTLDNVLKSQFDIENTGGVVHLSTPQPASLVVTGRTYNQTDAGTFGQFVPAVTVDQAVGAGERTLHILQVEDSTRYRTNVGLAEVTGKPVTVEIQVVLPDSKITPTVQVPLAANEFRQFNVIRELGVGNVYNGRVSIRVIDGQGRVTAYGSVIDEVTQDPTYVPAQ